MHEYKIKYTMTGECFFMADSQEEAVEKFKQIHPREYTLELESPEIISVIKN